MTDEKLIEKSFKAHEDAPTWQDDPVARDAAIRWHMRGFNDALAVFEKARSNSIPVRSEVPEPQDEPSDAPAVQLMARKGGKTQALIDSLLGQANERGIRVEVVYPQVEPTDAQVAQAKDAVSRIAGLSLLRRHSDLTDGWWSDLYAGIARAALRAACEEGKKR